MDFQPVLSLTFFAAILHLAFSFLFKAKNEILWIFLFLSKNLTIRFTLRRIALMGFYLNSSHRHLNRHLGITVVEG